MISMTSNNEKYNQIIDEVYENYSKEYEKDNSIGLTLLVQRVDGKSVYRKPDKQMFIGLCTYDKTFSEKWGLKIEERELSFKERNDYGINVLGYEGLLDFGHTQNDDDKILYCLNAWGVPTKLITITYNNETIESYE